MNANGSLIFQLLFLFILVGINAFFASSEIAIISLNEHKVRKAADKGNKNARLLLNLISEPSRFLATIQVGVTLSGLLASAFAAESFAGRIPPLVKSIGIQVDDSIVRTVSLIIITVILSYITLVFGELIPKRVALQKPDTIANLSIKPLSLLLFVASPFVKLLTLSTDFIIGVFGGNPAVNDEKVTEEEIRLMVDIGEEKGIIRETEKDMINNIFDFDNTSVSEVMTHRKEVVGIPLGAKKDDIIEVLIREKYTRLPVYDLTIDNIVGILHVKDFTQYILQMTADKQFDLKELMRQPLYVPVTKKTDDLFKELQKKKTHMAVVLDEYGGTAGIVTVEDLLEEIVGNILDEHDEDEEKRIITIDKNTYVLNGAINLDEVSELLEVELPIGDYDTLSGYIVAQLGRIPGEDENPVIEFDNITFRVEKIQAKRISRVKVYKT